MSNCSFCDRTLANNKQIVLRCTSCGAVFCGNGNCRGSFGKGMGGGSCKACNKSNVVKPV